MKTLAATLLAAALPQVAAAAVVITPFLGGPFSEANPVGTLPATVVAASNTYDFTFSLVAPLTGISATQVAAVINRGNLRKAELVQYAVYEGVPTPSDPENGTLLATSLKAFSPTVFLKLGPGDYYVNLLPSEISVGNEVVSGSFVTAPAAIPEPASWAVMLLGASAMGAVLRKRRVTFD